MSESERKESKPDVEDNQIARQEEVKDENGGKDVPKGPESDAKIVAEAEKVPAITVGDGGDEADADGDSEAETLIQSPEKKRNSLVESSTMVHQVKVAGSDTGSIILANTSDKENATRKRKRSQEGAAHSPSRTSSHHSSPLSSPVMHMQTDPESDGSAASVREASPKRQTHSDAEDKIDSPRKRRRRPSEIIPPSSAHKRSKRSSFDNTERRETRSATYPRPSDDEQSASPEPATRSDHRRGASTQLTTGEFEKRKRGRPPLINTRRNHSVDRGSEASDESEPRSSRPRPALHKLVSQDHDIMSPAKVGPRKWKDKVGRTPLARACNDGDLEGAKARFAERPEDLHEQDNAKNTPLQIASIEGWEEVVEFLLSKGAEVNVKNIDGDSPLIDAVENGHVPVIKLLLRNGANARMANTKGYEPSELAKKDDDNYEEIRELLNDAKEKHPKKIAGMETYEYHNRDGTSSRAASAASPRDSPPIGARSPPAFGSRRRTGRSESTRNDLLYQANTQENLVKLAGKGDVQGVANILSILEKADTEALIAAAKAGHEEVLQLLIAMGKPNPDPDPVRGTKMVPGYNTPMLAAIGRGHPDVVRLLANQAEFNPTRRFRDRTYFELAEDRRGDRWEEEMQVLKQAYERYRDKKAGSPRRTKDADKLKTRPGRRSSSVNSASRRMPSPTTTRESLTSKSKDGIQLNRRKVSDPVSEKRRHSGNDDVTESSVAIASDLDQTVDAERKVHRTRRSQSDLPPLSTSSQEPAQRRRRLVTGKEHRSRHTISTSSDNEEMELAELKQDDRPQSALKRSRVSSTPDPPNDASERAASKKRRTVLESSPDEARSRASIPSEPTHITFESEVKPKENIAIPGPESAAMIERALPSDLLEELPGEIIKRESPPIATSASADPERLPDAEAVELVAEPIEAEDDSEDSYSPPPATLPHADTVDTANEEAERRAKEDADRVATEQAAHLEEARKVQEQRAAQEQAVEEARQKREAEERKRQEEEQARRRQEAEKQERQKQEIESRRRQESMERERKRVDALPTLLARTAQMIDGNDPTLRDGKWLKKVTTLYSVKTSQLDPSCGANIADEKWVASFQVAVLLSTKDLSLLSYTPFDKRPASNWERQCLWRVARSDLTYDFNPTWTTSTARQVELERINEEKFMAMSELFWVKWSDVQDQASRLPHLSNNNIQLRTWPISLKPYSQIFSSKITLQSKQQHGGLPNGIANHAIHVNGENGVS
ncbi:hypothetical protein OHC33_003751 [Knufia fluminis]|uniref:Uncharacterized protein n=1 Tax=Knufia fluminis TaxID=191047 RepID=A0AAN8IPG6_9EURO|nr:hypothetical protein OHC33_003751 [Knufia fluminis]